MISSQICKRFIEAVYCKGEQSGYPVNGPCIANELFGGDPKVVAESLKNVAGECKAAGLLLVSPDFMELRLTDSGRAFIGK